MEKRFFLAAVLSLGVLFVFQGFFNPTKDATTVNSMKIQQQFAEKTGSSELQTTLNPAIEPVKQPLAFIEKTVVLENKLYRVDVTNKGANVSTIFLKQYDYVFPAKHIATFDAFDNLPFDLDLIQKNKIRGVCQIGSWLIQKDITLNDNFTINISFLIKNIVQSGQTFLSKHTNILIDLEKIDKHNALAQIKPNTSDYSLLEYAVKTDKNIIRKNNATNFNEKWNIQKDVNIEWVSFRDKYFAIIVQPQEVETNYNVEYLSSKEIGLKALYAAQVFSPEQSKAYSYTVFAGPQQLDLLKNADKSFDQVMVFSDWGWLDAIAKVIHWTLGYIHKVVPSWGLCIIFISLLVYGAMYPLTLKGLLSMKKLQALQPKMKELQVKYKDNQEKLSKEIMELYRINQVNPLGGCLPMLLQMPIFVGLYQVLWRSIYFRGESFLWIKDLSLPDHTFKLPVTIPFLGEYINILPIVMVLIMGVQQKMNIQTSAGTEEQVAQQKMMAIMMPVLIGFIFYNMASGLNLYFVIFYTLSTLSQWHISKGSKAVV